MNKHDTWKIYKRNDTKHCSCELFIELYCCGMMIKDMVQQSII